MGEMDKKMGGGFGGGYGGRDNGGGRDGGGFGGRDGGFGSADEGRGGGRGFGRRRVCRYCTEKGAKVDYKAAGEMRGFLTERGKIIPRRISGNCAKHQRAVAVAIKRARSIALLPYTLMQGP